MKTYLASMTPVPTKHRGAVKLSEQGRRPTGSPAGSGGEFDTVHRPRVDFAL